MAVLDGFLLDSAGLVIRLAVLTVASGQSFSFAKTLDGLTF